MKKKNLQGIVAFAVLAAIILTFSLAYGLGGEAPASVSYNEFLGKLEAGEISEVVITEAGFFKFSVVSGESFNTDNPRRIDFKEFLLLNNIEVKEGTHVSAFSAVQNGLGILVFGAIGFFVYKSMNRSGKATAMALNACDSSKEGSPVLTKFEDIAGNDEAKDSIGDIVDYIKSPDKYEKYGAKIPRGVIFYGSPGTGKTLMAKAVAGEAGVPFYAVSGSDFVQMYVGVGAARIRELFGEARKSGGRAVIFIDEIDALAKKRSQNPMGGNDEREQTLNALLTEMSGFSEKSGEGIVVIAATNRIDTLDEAVLRPGRFDRLVEISLPDVKARKRILNYYCKNKPIGSIDIETIAKQTVYFSGAMLENLMNEAAIFAAKREAETIEQADVDRAFYTIVAGAEKTDRSSVNRNERYLTAVHEAGHALVSKLETENTVGRLTIIPSTKGAGGFCLNIPKDKMFHTKKDLEAQIMVSLAGRAGEEAVFGSENVTTGAANDIEKATQAAMDYISRFGMSEKLGIINLAGIGAERGAEAATECSAMLGRLYQKTLELIKANMPKLNALASELMEFETLDEADVNRIVA